MPKITKLHSKGKSNSIQKPCKAVQSNSDMDSEDSLRQFQLELCWCIQQLEHSLREKKNNEKQLQEAWKILTVLKNNNQPVIRKRQLMRTHFGDYRAKMAAEEKKLTKMASKMKITESPAQPKATFIRKSAFQTAGDNSFKFDFKLSPEQMESNNSKLQNIDGASSKSDSADTQSLSPESYQINAKNKDSLKKENHFKFVFSNSEFKFNFSINNV